MSNNLYNQLAEVYVAMYQSFVDYSEEFNVYKQLLIKHDCRSVVEIGCGAGNLAVSFLDAGFGYTGLDQSRAMLDIAERNNPGCSFVQACMQDFVLAAQVESAIITGRTISYLLTNTEVNDCLTAIHRNLSVPGILAFDFIDANAFIPSIDGHPVIHTASRPGKNFLRKSYWRINFSQSWTFDWLSVFYELREDGTHEKIGEDNSMVRAFTKDEILLFLQLAGFRVLEIFPRKSYAFDTFLVVAQKDGDAKAVKTQDHGHV